MASKGLLGYACCVSYSVSSYISFSVAVILRELLDDDDDDNDDVSLSLTSSSAQITSFRYELACKRFNSV